MFTLEEQLFEFLVLGFCFFRATDGSVGLGAEGIQFLMSRVSEREETELEMVDDLFDLFHGVNRTRF